MEFDSLINYSDINVIKECYKEHFNANDVFNHFLAKRYFPHPQKSGYESNFTDFLFAAIQMNLYTLYHEIMQEKNRMDHRKFTENLYRGLMKQLERRRKESNGEKWI
jgi:hypothetical protein